MSWSRVPPAVQRPRRPACRCVFPVYLSVSVARGPAPCARCPVVGLPVSTVGQQSSPLCVAEDVAAAAAAASDGQRALQRPGTRRERPSRDARAQLGSPAAVRRGGLGPRGHGERTRIPQRHRRHTAADNDHHRPKFRRGTSEVSIYLYREARRSGRRGCFRFCRLRR